MEWILILFKLLLDRIYRISRIYFIFLSFLMKLRNFIRFRGGDLKCTLLYIASTC